MVPRSANLQARAQAESPASVRGRAARLVSRFLPVAVLSVGVLLAGSSMLQAQDVPPPPPDSSQQQDNQQDNQPLPQYGAPVGQDNGAQQAPAPENGQAPAAPQGQPLGADQLNQLVAPIALYPDSLVAQILAAATYPTQIVEADRWLESQGNLPPDQIAAGANAQQWDPSVKALTAVPSVLSQLDKNLQWTTDLGNAYYNQPQDVMDAVQRMRQQAQQAGNLQSTPQQAVTDDGGEIEIAPANPDVVYVPVYDPWMVYGSPIMAFPGYYYAPPPGLFIGFGYGIRFGIGIPLRPWRPWGWGWHNWGCGWHNHIVVYNRTAYITRSFTVVNHGFNRPGGPPMALAGQRGSFLNHPGFAGYAHNVAAGARPMPHAPGNYVRPALPTGGYHPGAPANRAPQYAPRQTYRPNQQYRPSQNYSRPAQNYNRPAQHYNRPAQNYSRPAAPHSAPAPHVSAPHGGGGEHRR